MKDLELQYNVLKVLSKLINKLDSILLDSDNTNESLNTDVQLLSKIGEQKENGSLPNNIESKDM